VKNKTVILLILCVVSTKFLAGSLKEDTAKVYLGDDSLRYADALSFFQQEDYELAEQCLIDATNSLLQRKADYDAEKFYAREIIYTELYTNILVNTGRFEEALEYNKKKNELRKVLHDYRTHKLEDSYDLDNEIRTLEQIKELTNRKQQSIYILISISILLLIIMLLLWLWFLNVKKNSKRRADIIRKETEEAERQLRIVEEQGIKIDQENKAVLSDYNRKQMEMDDQSKLMKQLSEEKEKLDRQVEDYIKKIKEYEELKEAKAEKYKAEDARSVKMVEDITRLINKKLPGHKEYINLMRNINGQYLYFLCESYNGKLSVPYIKYCICFAIGMGIPEVARCFSIEPSSVHMVRYRLKKKFGLGIENSLELFLKSHLPAPPPPNIVLSKTTD